MLMSSFPARFLAFALLVALMAILGGAMLRFVARWLPQGAQAVVGA